MFNLSGTEHSKLSSTGAAGYILNNTKGIRKLISNESLVEFYRGVKKLSINDDKKPIDIEVFEVVGTARTYRKYTSDPNDSHVVAAAHQSLAKYLLTYNMKHYKIGLIKEDLGILVTTPGDFLQYLKSQN